MAQEDKPAKQREKILIYNEVVQKLAHYTFMVYTLLV